MLQIDKNKWKERSEQLFKATIDKLLGDKSFNEWSRLDSHHDGYYETPKKFLNGVAKNDGSWLRYKTERWSNGKLVTMVSVFSKEKLTSIFYDYTKFLRKDGVNNRGEMTYYVMKFLIDKLFIPEGLFECDDQNCKLIISICDEVLNKDPDQIKIDRQDPRKTCFDPRFTKGMARSNMLRISKKVKKNERYEQISKYYKPGLSYRQVAKMMNEDGIKISKSTVENWVKENI